MLKYTGVKLELLTDVEMLNMFELGMRGGISSTLTTRYAKANNKYLKDFDNSKVCSFIQYMDANNLYGKAMSQKLPVSDFKFIRDEFLTEEHIMKYTADGDLGAIVECDLEYPKELHDKHNNYPMAPEKVKVKKS